ncbi:MAG: iron ABC transporter [Bacteroidetes bacterium]|nr:iron ABC transporter [Bacteroidota bacterium]|tara:strand:+ start:5279 stop:6319 length:1041 start_codon:yes stop_codon:yes gene_type:complete
MNSNKHRRLIFVILPILIVVLFLINLWYGSVNISWIEVWETLMMNGNTSQTSKIIILQYRLPQAITAMAVGIGLSIAGLLLQTTFSNPLAGPSVLGISAGASLGVALMVLLGGVVGVQLSSISMILGDMAIVLAAFAGALAVLLIIIFVSGKVGNAVTILIIGIMIGYLVSAIVGTLQFFSSSEDLHAFILWGLGSFSKTSITQSLMIFIVTFVVFVVTMVYVKPLNALLLGQQYAISSGFSVRLLQSIFILISGFLIALGTAFTGPIAFVGLAVPHIARTFFRTSNHGVLLPAVVLIGAALTLGCNFISKLPGYDASLPINAVTSIVGAPIVIWVIIKGRRMTNG